jgi:hypothetical protein
MQPDEKEPTAQPMAPQEPAERAAGRREWQPPRGEIVDVASGTRSGVLGGVDGVSCHS